MFNSSRFNYRPFGVRRVNNVTFERSVTNPNSVLAKVVRYLRNINRPATRLEIALNAMGYDPIKTTQFKGWNTNLFCGMTQAGFLTVTRTGNRWYYTLGPLANKVVP